MAGFRTGCTNSVDSVIIIMSVIYGMDIANTSCLCSVCALEKKSDRSYLDQDIKSWSIIPRETFWYTAALAVRRGDCC